MSIFLGWGERARGLFADNKGPWGSAPGDGDGGEPPPEGGGGPWGEPPRRRRHTSGSSNMPSTSLEDFFRRGTARFGGGLPGRPSGSIIFWILVALVGVWLVFTTMHSIGPAERGVVTQLGRYNRTLGPGVNLTLPWPIERLTKVNVSEARSVDLGTDDLMLTGDQNLIDIAYSVSWYIRDPQLYLFELRDPQGTVSQVAESAMRSVIAQVSLNDAMGPKRGDIVAAVQNEMQQILDEYRTGIVINNVAIRKADPPDAVNEAFKKVTAAQQQAQSYINGANTYATQVVQRAQGDATAFDKVYAQYKLAPEVTRRRMYYETMERVLANVDKTVIEAPGVTPYLPLPQIQKSPRQEPSQ
ncbi:MAG TPA: FtsH protease activity modulator HflK [Sphingomicrobium sp.]|nr:FtsH protease activity modulator HflK [Sphingomicrobium sp.]